jgi:hypothetical protein
MHPEAKNFTILFKVFYSVEHFKRRLNPGMFSGLQQFEEIL